MNRPQPLTQSLSSRNRMAQLVMGGALVIAGLLIGLSVPHSLSLELKVGDNQALTIEVHTVPWPSPLGKAEFWASTDGGMWRQVAADENGFDGWRVRSEQNITEYLQVRVEMTDVLGQTHTATRHFFAPSVFGLNELQPLGVAEATPQLLELLLSGDFASREKGANWMALTGERSFLPYLVEVMAFHQGDALTQALQTLSGQSFGGARAQRLWYEWMWTQFPQLDDHFWAWKRRLFERQVPSLEPLLSERGTLDWRTVVWGGVPPGGIPPLNAPATLPASQAGYLQDNDIVFGAELNGRARAYPVRVMDWHELANDELGGVPVVVSYCPLCGSAVLFGRMVNERVHTFNTSGLLYQSNKLMFDEQTLSLWPNLSGEPLAGTLASQGVRLNRYPLTTTTWAQWRLEHPHTDVVDPSGHEWLSYDTHEAYELYRVSRDTLAPVSGWDDRLPAKDWVFGLQHEGGAFAFSIQQLETLGVWNGHVGGRALVVFADPLPGSRFGFYPATVRAYARQAFEFTRSENGIVDQHRNAWTLKEDALVSQNGERLERMVGETAYWFAWHSFHPDTQLLLPSVSQ